MISVSIVSATAPRFPYGSIGTILSLLVVYAGSSWVEKKAQPPKFRSETNLLGIMINQVAVESGCHLGP